MYTPPLHPTRCVPFRFRVPLVAFHPRSPASTHVSLSVPPFCYRYKDKVHRSFDKARNVLPPAGCAALFFSWGKTLPGISTTSTSPPFFSYLFFLFFTLFQNTLYHYLDLLPPSPFSLFSFRSLVISIRRKNSILLIDQNIRTRGIVIAWYALNFHLKIWSSSERTKFILYTLDIFSGGIGGHPVCAWIGIKVNGDNVFRIGWHEFMGWRVIKI